MAQKKHVCTGECRKKSTAEMAAGASLLGLAIGAMVACPGFVAQPLYGVPVDDDDSAQVDDDDATDDDDSAQVDDDDSAATDDDDAVDG